MPRRRFSQILFVSRLDSSCRGLKWPWEVLTRKRSLYSLLAVQLKPPAPWHFGYRWFNLLGRKSPQSKELRMLLCRIDKGVRWAGCTCSACSAGEQSPSWLTLLFIHERRPSEADSFVPDTFNKWEKKKHNSQKQLNNYGPLGSERTKVLKLSAPFV